jgi:hypothetical protein
MQSSTIVTILSAVVSFAAVVSAPALDAVWPGHGTYLMGVISLAALAAGVVINALTKKTNGTPEHVIAQDATVVNPQTGAVVGTNVSTTSTAPIMAPQAPIENPAQSLKGLV